MTLSYPIKDENLIRAMKSMYLKRGLMRDLLLFNLAINTGMKLVDLLELKVGDVRNKGYLTISSAKDGLVKTIPLNEEVQNLIKPLISTRPNDDALFKTRTNGVLDRTIVHKNFQQICKELGVSDKYSVLSWRKTFGYHYFRKTGDMSMLLWIFNSSTIEKLLTFIDSDANLNFRFEKGFAI